MGSASKIQFLRTQIDRMEARERPDRSVLPFGIVALDANLSGGGLVRGALHEVAGAQADPLHDAAAALFIAGIAARAGGIVLWCVSRADLFAPALMQAGLKTDRVIHVEAGDDTSVLACMEEGLRHGGPRTVVGEVTRLSMVASRRLQLAAEESDTFGLALRRCRRSGEAAHFGQPNAAMTRWRISALPSSPLPVPGVGRPRWRVELLRARGGGRVDLELEACDATGCLAVPAALADRQDPAAGRRAAG